MWSYVKDNLPVTFVILKDQDLWPLSKIWNAKEFSFRSRGIYFSRSIIVLEPHFENKQLFWNKLLSNLLNACFTQFQVQDNYIANQCDSTLFILDFLWKHVCLILITYQAGNITNIFFPRGCPLQILKNCDNIHILCIHQRQCHNVYNSIDL